MGAEEKEQEVKPLFPAIQDTEAIYDKGYDDGWKARDEMAGRALKEAEQLAFDNGFVAGVNATINRKPHNPIDG